MKLPTFRLRTLLALTALIGIALGVLFASAAWTGVFVTSVWLLIGTAILAAIYSHGETRAFCIGFSLFCSAYFWALSRNELQFLLSTPVIVAIAKQLNRYRVAPGDQYVRWGSLVYIPFEFHAHLVCCVVAGLIGGFVALALCRIETRSRAKHTSN